MPITFLARLLLLERLRKSNLHYGWAGYTSAGMGLLLLGWFGLNLVIRYARHAGFQRLEFLFISLWIAWSLLSTITGKDLSWRINRERILVLPSQGFLTLYILVFALGFLSIPLLLFLLIVQFWTFLQPGFGLAHVFAVSGGYLFFVASVRLCASLARVALYEVGQLPGALKLPAILAAVFIPSGTLAAALGAGMRGLHPGHLFALILSGKQYGHPLASLFLWTALLGLADLLVQHDLTYSGIRGPLALRNGTKRRCSVLLFHPAWPGPLFRIGVLGWLRSRSALLLFVWGGAYSFLWTYYSGPDDVFYFFLFIWMNLLFHSHLRGNLLGIDRAAAWLYYMLPCRIDFALSSRSLSLSLLQGSMVASLLAAGFIQADTHFETADWGRILSYALSAIAFGEICGFYFSVKYPDSIDPKSRFDGSTTVGALAVPVLQIAFLFLFILISGRAWKSGMTSTYWGLLLAVPLFLFIARSFVLNTWAAKAMGEDREALLKKLSG